MKKSLLGVACSLFMMLAAHVPAKADLVAVGVGDYSDSRNSGTGGGIDATEEWADGNFVLSWDITDNGGGSFTYRYMIEGSGGGDLPKELSHWILQLTPDTLWTDVFGTNTEVRDFSSSESGNPLIPADVFGVKFDDLMVAQFFTEFTVNHAPVWGDFYAKDGGGQENAVVAFNANFGDWPSDFNDFNGFIARPDGITVDPGPIDPVPEPSTLSLLGIGLIGGAVFRKRFQ